jgi:transcriptional regulator with XRE-family HTH domain
MKSQDGPGVRASRIKHGLSQRQVGTALRISPQRLSLLERGELDVDPEYAAYMIAVIQAWPEGAAEYTPAFRWAASPRTLGKLTLRRVAASLKPKHDD